jgi:hypothetical protein
VETMVLVVYADGVLSSAERARFAASLAVLTGGRLAGAGADERPRGKASSAEHGSMVVVRALGAQDPRGAEASVLPGRMRRGGGSAAAGAPSRGPVGSDRQQCYDCAMIASSGSERLRHVVGRGTLAAGALLALSAGGCGAHHRTAALEQRVATLETELYELRAKAGPTAPDPYAPSRPSAARPRNEGHADRTTPHRQRRMHHRMSLEQAWRDVCEGPDSVPLELSGSRLFVDVSLRGPKGTGRFRFQVDTGGSTPGLSLARSAADALGFARAQGADALPRIIAIGGREITVPEGVTWVVLDDATSPRGSFTTRRTYSLGQIGAGFLGRFLVCIDPAQRRLGLADPEDTEIDPHDPSALPILVEPLGQTRALVPFVHVLLEARGAYSGSYGMLLDTGATTSMLEKGELDRQSKSNPEWPRIKGAAGDADMLGGQWPEGLLRASALYIASPGLEQWRESPPSREEWEQFPKLHSPVEAGPALFVERPQGSFRKMFGEVGYAGGPHGALGNDVLSRFRMMIDYRGARLWLKPEAAPPAISASMERVGLALSFGADGCPVVRQVTDTNDAETRTKLRAGDTLLSVDGETVCQAWHHQIAEKLAGRPGERKQIELRRGAQKLVVDVPIVDLLAARGTQRPGDALFGKDRSPQPPGATAPKRQGDTLFGTDRPAPKPAPKPAPGPTRPADGLFR